MKLASALLISLLIGACAGAPRRDARTERPAAAAPAKTIAAKPEPPTRLGPQTPGDAPPAPEAQAAPAPPPSPPKRAAVVETSRDDGRPRWWFSDIERTDGALRLCSEALGADMVEARRAALDAGRQRMRAELGLSDGTPIAGERVEKAWVWPLPNGRAGPMRYAGYTLIAAPIDR